MANAAAKPCVVCFQKATHAASFLTPLMCSLLTDIASRHDRDRLDLVMIEEAIDEKELAFLRQLEEHEDEWVAFVEDHGAEFVVGSGKDAVEAIQDAEKRGFPDAVLMKVPRFDRGIIPSNFS